MREGAQEARQPKMHFSFELAFRSCSREVGEELNRFSGL